MNLAIFDIDGTLTDTNAADTQAYFDALDNVFGLSLQKVDLNRFKHSSDLGILIEILLEHFGRLPESDEVERFKCQFLSLLTKIAENSPLEFREIRGAKSFLQNLRQKPEWEAAIATGCFFDSAVLKMQRAEIPYEEMPIATCEDHIERTRIIQKALQKAMDWYEVEEFEYTIYLGDGVWDVRAAAQLGLPFLAVGRRFSELLRSGAGGGIRDFSDRSAAYAALRCAQVPRAQEDQKSVL